MPGELAGEALIHSMIRVNQAGEYGAARIYAGQLAVLGDSEDGPVLREMAEQEQKHLDTFNRMIVERQVRPTVMTPVWHVAGFALGAATALMGREAAMACTVAVEEVIDEHYADQAARLDDSEAELKKTIEDFRADELAHKDTALARNAEAAPAYPLLTRAIRDISRTAIRISKRV
ncbi:MAG: demethoxyubiquinone hydroxylase family protein [Rhodospirillaceae bacterium]|nr:demethoxyubiquinone hydroxylase family protein [Rhodospirillaceae bacterium]MYB14776.1 demethoxyubiquinone hydroxylase family protein [Rhodospirillaceae bacterium]MYI50103.1 demethoxyubiquinone hydroxylase family protein [Rhodospirillaceae bacterium]